MLLGCFLLWLRRRRWIFLWSDWALERFAIRLLLFSNLRCSWRICRRLMYDWSLNRGGICPSLPSGGPCSWYINTDCDCCCCRLLLYRVQRYSCSCRLVKNESSDSRLQLFFDVLRYLACCCCYFFVFFDRPRVWSSGDICFCTPNERVWCITQLAKAEFSTIQSVVLTAVVFSAFYKMLIYWSLSFCERLTCCVCASRVTSVVTCGRCFVLLCFVFDPPADG